MPSRRVVREVDPFRRKAAPGPQALKPIFGIAPSFLFGVALLLTGLSVPLSTHASTAATPSASSICKTAQDPLKLTLTLHPPHGRDVLAVKLALRYPPRSVGLPGSQAGTTLASRVHTLLADTFVSPTNLDDQLILSVARAQGLGEADLVTVEFDRCEGSPRVAATDFACTVEEASGQAGAIRGVSCTVRVT